MRARPFALRSAPDPDPFVFKLDAVGAGENVRFALRTNGNDQSNLVPGQERWVAEKRREVISSVGRAPVELIRVDFLTRPVK